jgi:hypothetical protein
MASHSVVHKCELSFLPLEHAHVLNHEFVHISESIPRHVSAVTQQLSLEVFLWVKCEAIEETKVEERLLPIRVLDNSMEQLREYLDASILLPFPSASHLLHLHLCLLSSRGIEHGPPSPPCRVLRHVILWSMPRIYCSFLFHFIDKIRMILQEEFIGQV